MMTRVKLRKLAGSDWDETPVRKMAQNLGQATKSLRKLVQSWYDKETTYFDIAIPIEIQKIGNQQATSGSWDIRLLAEKEVDIDFWDALIGLYVWSIKRQNSDLKIKERRDFVKTFNLKGRDAHQARLLYRKWTNDDSVLEHNHPHSVACLKGCETFRYLRSSGSPQTDQTPLIRVTSDYNTLAVQDIYIHILHSMLQQLPILGGMTQIIGHDKETYRFSNDRIEELVNAFISAGLGDRREGIICILSVLSDQGLLPESTYDSVEVRRHMEKLEKLDNNDIFTVSEWLCLLADHGEVEHVMVEYGYICLRNLMDRDDSAKSFALERIMAILKANDGGLSTNSISTYLTGIESIPSVIWCKNYRNQLYWITSRILQFQPIGNHFPRVRLILNDFEKLQPIKYELSEVYQDEQEAALSRTILLESWFELDHGDYLGDEHTGMLLDWLVKNRHDNILEWFVIRMINELSPDYSHYNMKGLLSHATSKRYREAVEIIWRHIDRFNIRVFVLEALASDGDVQTLENILGRDFSGHSTIDHEAALLKAAEGKKPAVIKFLLIGGVDVDAQNSQGRTALMIAAKEGDFESTSLLRSYNASLEMRDHSGDTALIQAVVHGHANIVEYFIDHGADVNTRDLWGRTLLILATLHKNLPLIEYLCEHGADINASDDNQMNAVDVAARGDNINGPWTEGYDFLSSRGAKSNVPRRIEDIASS
ncbi:ankyrin repeat-containing protein [Talaromyces pinophilus]|uniref:Ankyrin repeat-containing protein n=1 Tax=Talaromyces pinophilus TaxID=128442 RepID=A0A6V8HGD4_TALPI|nr:ankyrin repeat-containing protein [Talaromyces pinophilus]